MPDLWEKNNFNEQFGSKGPPFQFDHPHQVLCQIYCGAFAQFGYALIGVSADPVPQFVDEWTDIVDRSLSAP